MYQINEITPFPSANQLNPVLNKLLEYTITDVTCTQSPPKTPLDCSQSPTAPRYKPPASPPQPTASAADIQQILDTFNQNKRFVLQTLNANLHSLKNDNSLNLPIFTS